MEDRPGNLQGSARTRTAVTIDRQGSKPMPTSATDSMDQLAIDTIRTLAMDAVEAAKSGHPGTPMALAPVIYTLWQRFLRFDPDNPSWPNRDRFVLSAGYVGTTGTRIAMVSFGASAPYKDLFRHFGFTVARVLAASKQQIEQHKEIKREPADIFA